MVLLLMQERLSYHMLWKSHSAYLVAELKYGWFSH